MFLSDSPLKYNCMADVDVKVEVTYKLAEAYLRVFAEKLRIKKKPKEEG